MTDNEIDEEIEGSPGKSDLEIALALQTDEGSVKKRRILIEKKKAEAAKAKAKLEEEDFGDKPSPPKEEKPVPTPEPRPAVKGVAPKAQRYYLRSKSGNVIELFRANDSKTTIIFESNEY